LRENIDVFDFDLDDREYESITKLNKNLRYYDPEFQNEGIWNYTPYFS